jgi:hypothetical protein
MQVCLQSLFEKINDVPFEVIVLDNASTDNSISQIRKHFPRVKIIISRENVGFARGVNTAAKKAEGEYLVFLNSDTVLEENALSAMITYMKDNPKTGVMGGCLVNKDTSTSASYGSFYSLFNVFSMLFFQRRRQLFDKITAVDWVSGGFMFIRRDLFLELGGFDEHFFMYIEDMELCFRIAKKGLKAIYFPKAKASHVGQGSSNRTFAIVHISRGLLYFYKKHKPIWQYFVVQLLLMIKSGASYAIGMLTRNEYLAKTYGQVIKEII